MTRTLKNQRGFTLVELIVASTLMTLVLSGVYLTFSTAVRAWRAGESNYAPYQDARRALGILERDLNGIPLNAQHLVVGNRDTLEFVTLAAPMDVEAAQGAQLLQVRYRITEVDDIDCLVREEALVVPPLPAVPAEGDRGLPGRINVGRSTPFVLAQNVVSFNLAYFWPAPDLTLRPPGVPPKPVPILTATSVDYALPQGISVQLILRDEGNLSNEQQTAFGRTVTLQIPVSSVPDALLRSAGFRR